jgi:hypothetical protein
MPKRAYCPWISHDDIRRFPGTYLNLLTLPVPRKQLSILSGYYNEPVGLQKRLESEAYLLVCCFGV